MSFSASLCPIPGLSGEQPGIAVSWPDSAAGGSSLTWYLPPVSSLPPNPGSPVPECRAVSPVLLSMVRRALDLSRHDRSSTHVAVFFI